MKISLAIFTGFALLALVSADLIMSVPDHCVLVTFNNTCLGCEPSYDLNNQTNTCTFKNVTAPITIFTTTTSQSTAAVIDNKVVLPQKLDLSNANVHTLLTNLDSQISSTNSSSNSSNSSSPQNNIVILSSVIKTVSSSSSANSESLTALDTTNTTTNNGTPNNGTSNNNNTSSTSNNTGLAAAQNSSSIAKTSSTTVTISTDTKMPTSTIASTASTPTGTSSGTGNSNSGSNSTVQFSSGFSIKSVDDLNCKIKANDSTCSVCYDSYYYSTNDKLCVPVSPTCKTWNRLGDCLTCYDGYELSQT